MAEKCDMLYATRGVAFTAPTALSIFKKEISKTTV
jgi:hypothetical protein